jgi:hypothetical protein
MPIICTNSAFYLFAKYSKFEYFLNDNVDLWNCIYFQGFNNIYMSYFYAGILTNYRHNNRKDNYPFCNTCETQNSIGMILYSVLYVF